MRNGHRAGSIRTVDATLTTTSSPRISDCSRVAVSIDGETVTPVSLLTARVDGEPVACGACFDEGDYVEVKRMYVLPACRGLGLGKQLLEAMEHHVRRGGGRLVRLEAGTAQTEALELYERAGYRRCPPFGDHRANPRSVCMEKALA